jgi:hypothetical protein
MLVSVSGCGTWTCTHLEHKADQIICIQFGQRQAQEPLLAIVV